MKNKKSSTNEDLFFSPIDEYMRTHMTEREIKEEEASIKPKVVVSSDESEDELNEDCLSQIPRLTGKAHILMERNKMVYSKESGINPHSVYDLIQNGKKLDMCSEHFQPIFFAKDTKKLSKNKDAREALRLYRIFPRPDDVHEELMAADIAKT